MSNKKIDSLVVQMESHLECWKQFAHYINMARSKKFELEDEAAAFAYAEELMRVDDTDRKSVV